MPRKEAIGKEWDGNKGIKHHATLKTGENSFNVQLGNGESSVKALITIF